MRKRARAYLCACVCVWHVTVTARPPRRQGSHTREDPYSRGASGGPAASRAGVYSALGHYRYSQPKQEADRPKACRLRSALTPREEDLCLCCLGTATVFAPWHVLRVDVCPSRVGMSTCDGAADETSMRAMCVFVPLCASVSDIRTHTHIEGKNVCARVEWNVCRSAESMPARCRSQALVGLAPTLNP